MAIVYAYFAFSFCFVCFETKPHSVHQAHPKLNESQAGLELVTVLLPCLPCAGITCMSHYTCFCCLFCFIF